MIRIQSALLAALHREQAADRQAALAGLSAEEWSAVADLAIRQRVAPLLLHDLGRSGRLAMVPAGAAAALREHARAAAVHGVRFQAEFAALARAAAPLGIPVVALKGLHLAATVYETPALRVMNDIDVLVPADALARVADAARALGYRPMYDVDVDLTLATSMHLPRFAKPGVELEIHWRFTDPAADLHVPTGEVMARAVPFPLVPPALALAAEDLLLHVCIHGASQHCFEQGLRVLCDVRAILERHGDTLGWDDVVTRAAEWKCARATLLVLRLSRELLGAAVPAAALARLGDATLTSDLVSSSERLIFEEREFSTGMSQAAGGLLSVPSGRRLAYLREHLWPSRPILASVYSLPAGAGLPTVAYYRVKRIADVIRRYGCPLVSAWWRPRSAERVFIDRRNAVKAWLEG